LTCVFVCPFRNASSAFSLNFLGYAISVVYHFLLALLSALAIVMKL